MFIPETIRLEASSHHILYQRVADTWYGSDCTYCERERRYQDDLVTARMLITFHLVFAHRITKDLTRALETVTLPDTVDAAVGQLRHRGVNTALIAHELLADRSTVARILARLRATGWEGEPDRVVGADGRAHPTRLVR